jgi:hypothetical protein
MRSLAFLFAALVASSTVTGCFSSAQPGEAHAMRNGYSWLGERFVNGGADHDVIGVGRADGKFNSIMIVVENAPVEVFDMVVTFGDGERFEPKTRLVFGPDSTSRMIDLPGHNRVIRRVDFRYGNLAGGGQAKVELWAR